MQLGNQSEWLGHSLNMGTQEKREDHDKKMEDKREKLKERFNSRCIGCFP